MIEKRKNIFHYIWEYPQYSMLTLIAAWSFYYFFFGYVLSVNDGFGYDGNYYGTTAKKFYQQVFGGELTFYRIQRIFPSFIMSCLLTILNLPKENYYVVKLWQIYHMVLLQVCVLIWIRIANMYKLDLRYIWLGFFLGFVNFANVMVTFWYPVLTDLTAFTLGFLLLYFHLKNNLMKFFKFKILIIVIIILSFACSNKTKDKTSIDTNEELNLTND